MGTNKELSGLDSCLASEDPSGCLLIRNTDRWAWGVLGDKDTSNRTPKAKRDYDPVRELSLQSVTKD